MHTSAYVSTLPVTGCTYWGAPVALYGHTAANSWRSLTAVRDKSWESVFSGYFHNHWTSVCDSPSLPCCPYRPTKRVRDRDTTLPHLKRSVSFVCTHRFYAFTLPARSGDQIGLNATLNYDITDSWGVMTFNNIQSMGIFYGPISNKCIPYEPYEIVFLINVISAVCHVQIIFIIQYSFIFRCVSVVTDQWGRWTHMKINQSNFTHIAEYSFHTQHFPKVPKGAVCLTSQTEPDIKCVWSGL